MNKGAVKNLALILLLGVAIFSMVKYVSELRARFILQDGLAKAQGEILDLSQEKQNLLQELGKEKELNAGLAVRNLGLKAYLRASQHRLIRLFKEDRQTRDDLEEVSAKFTVLKAENRALINSRKRAYLENEQLKLKLSSVVELKKAMRELKARRSPEAGLTDSGNRGFLFWKKRSSPEKVKIEVVPDSPQAVPPETISE